MIKNKRPLLDKYRPGLIAIVLLLLTTYVQGQNFLNYPQWGASFNRLKAETLFGLPSDTFAVPAAHMNTQWMANKSNTVYTWNITTHIWELFKSGGTLQQALTAGNEISNATQTIVNSSTNLTGSLTIAEGSGGATKGSWRNAYDYITFQHGDAASNNVSGFSASQLSQTYFGAISRRSQSWLYSYLAASKYVYAGIDSNVVRLKGDSIDIIGPTKGGKLILGVLGVAPSTSQQYLIQMSANNGTYLDGKPTGVIYLGPGGTSNAIGLGIGTKHPIISTGIGFFIKDGLYQLATDSTGGTVVGRQYATNVGHVWPAPDGFTVQGEARLDSTVRANDLPVYGGTSELVVTIDASGYLKKSVALSTLSGGVGGGSVTSVDVSGGTTGLTTSGGPVTTTGTITLAGTLAGANGGTGVSNSGKTITLGGNFATSGAFATTLTVGAATNVTLPSTGTLATLAGSETLTNKSVNGVTLVNGGTATLYLSQDGTYTTPAGGGGSPGGSNTQIQFNNSSAFGGSSQFTFTGQAVQLGSTNTTQSTTSSAFSFAPASLTTGTGFYGANGTLTTGKLFDLNITGTAAATGQTVLNISTSGANATGSQTTYGAQIANTKTNGVNVGLRLDASGAAAGSNFGLIVSTGTVGIGTATPTTFISSAGDTKLIVDAIQAWTNGGTLKVWIDPASDANMTFRNASSVAAVKLTTNGTSYFNGGPLSIKNGTGTATAYLHLGAGTATASTAPLKFTSGTLNTTAEAGAFEFLTDKAYFTITTSAARKEVALIDATLTPGTVPVTTTNGRLTDGLIISDGTITPTSSDANIASKTWKELHYIRVGNRVGFSGSVLVAATATGLATMAINTTSIVTSNFTLNDDVAGTVTDGDSVQTGLYMDATTSSTNLVIHFNATNTGSHLISFSGSYRVR